MEVNLGASTPKNNKILWRKIKFYNFREKSRIRRMKIEDDDNVLFTHNIDDRISREVNTFCSVYHN